jgi:hypothetical protein
LWELNIPWIRALWISSTVCPRMFDANLSRSL